MQQITLEFLLNNERIKDTVNTPQRVVDYLRSHKGQPGTKIGCLEGDCGACAVMIGEPTADNGALRYRAVLSCLLPVQELDGRHLVTIHGLNLAGNELNLVQRALRTHEAVQCGFCTPGFVVSLTAGLIFAPHVDENALITAAEGNICRCTGYAAIRRCIKEIATTYGSQLSKLTGPARIQKLIELNALPSYFALAPALLAQIHHELSCFTIPTKRKRLTNTGEVVGGGTDLLVGYDLARLRQQGENPVFVTRFADMNHISQEDDKFVIGGATKIEALTSADSPLQPIFGKERGFVNLIASEPLRKQATVAGNLVNASPIGDLSVMLLALGGELTIRNHDTRRTLQIEKFFLEYRKTVLKRCEILEKIVIDQEVTRLRFNFEKVAIRRYLDIACVNSAILLDIDDNIIKMVRISAGGVAPIPLLLKKTNKYLTGKPLTAKVLHKALSITEQEIAPISDIRGSAHYKRLLLSRLIMAHFVMLLPERTDLVSGDIS